MQAANLGQVHDLPDDKRVQQLLSDMAGRNVAVRKLAQCSYDGEQVAVAEYRRDDGELSFVCVADLPAAAMLGAVLTLVPPNAVADAVKQKQLSPLLEENLREMLNVVAQLLNGEGRPHVRLKAMAVRGELPREVMLLLGWRRADFAIEIPGYGKGKLSIGG